VPGTPNPPSGYMRLVEAHLSHNRTTFEVILICDDGDHVRKLVQVAVADILLLAPYLVLLGDSSTHPLHTEPPVVPVNRGVSGIWTFCRTTALRDQEPISPEPDALPLSSPPPPVLNWVDASSSPLCDRLTYSPICPSLESVDRARPIRLPALRRSQTEASPPPHRSGPCSPGIPRGSQKHLTF
jgi:hypothetical protein